MKTITHMQKIIKIFVLANLFLLIPGIGLSIYMLKYQTELSVHTLIFLNWAFMFYGWIWYNVLEKIIEKQIRKQKQEEYEQLRKQMMEDNLL